MNSRRCSRCSAPEGRYLGRLADCVPGAGWVYCDSPDDKFAGTPVVDVTRITLAEKPGGELLCERCVKDNERRAREQAAEEVALTRLCMKCRARPGHFCRDYRGRKKPVCKVRLGHSRKAKRAKAAEDQPSLF